MKEQIRESFKMIFDVYPNGIYFAPGRVNLIGEHTDYNGGNVFPCALEIGTYGAIRERKDSIIRMYSENFKENGIIEIDIKKINYNKQDDWANYPKGVIRIFQDCGHIIQSGFDILFSGNIPNGAGLSSSASIEILMAIILKDIFELEINMIEMVKLCQKAENSFVGVNSGIMDQFAVGMGKKDHAILLDTNTLDYRYALIRMDGISIVISNTNKKRGLQDSKYNERRNQCDEALRRLQKRLDIQTLGELTEEVFESNKHLIEDEVLIKRAKHAVLENLRTLKAVKLLEKGDIDGFGQLMIESHMSLKDDYEVTGRELDKLVEITLKQPGVIGSRMTGAGFGGCTVTLVRSDKVLDLIRNVGEEYINDIGYQAEFYVVKIGEGAHRIM